MDLGHLVGQIPGADEAMKAAAATGRWEPIFLVVIVLAILVSFGYVLRSVLSEASKREERLVARITEVENAIHEQLLTQIRLSQEAMTKMNITAERISETNVEVTRSLERFCQMLPSHPCFLQMPTDENIEALKAWIQQVKTENSV